MATLGITRPFLRIVAWLLGCASISLALALAPLLGIVVTVVACGTVAVVTAPGRRRS